MFKALNISGFGSYFYQLIVQNAHMKNFERNPLSGPKAEIRALRDTHSSRDLN